MKRSEMVQMLAGYLSTYVWYEEKHPQELMPLAEYVLQAIEKFGMQPPLNLRESNMERRDVHTWERE